MGLITRGADLLIRGGWSLVGSKPHGTVVTKFWVHPAHHPDITCPLTQRRAEAIQQKSNATARKRNHFRLRDDGAVAILLSGGHQAIIDIKDYEAARCSCFHWRAFKPQKSHTVYAVTEVKGPSRRVLFLHTLILNGEPRIDHKDGDGLNNRRSNLRPATRSENAFNQLKRGCTSKYHGVHRQKNRFIAKIFKDRKFIYLGSFELEDDAYAARLTAERVYYPNFPRCRV